MASKIPKQLKIKSNSDDVLREVKDYFRKYPNPPEISSAEPEIIALKEELAKLERLMSEEQLLNLKSKSK